MPISGLEVAIMALVMSALILAIAEIVRRQEQHERCSRCLQTACRRIKESNAIHS